MGRNTIAAGPGVGLDVREFGDVREFVGVEGVTGWCLATDVESDRPVLVGQLHASRFGPADT